MVEKLSVFLATEPGDSTRAAIYGLGIAQMAYKFGNGPCLLRNKLSATYKKGLMVIGDGGAMYGENYENLCTEIIRECTYREYTGVVLDFDGLTSNYILTLASKLSAFLSKRKLKVFVTESFAAACPDARVIISTAISGGSLKERLELAINKYGLSRIVLEIERLSMEFTLPALTGEGHRITLEELSEIYNRSGSLPFYSPELCTNYFTCQSSDGNTKFILFDDGRSILSKIDLAKQLGIDCAIMLFPEIEDILSEMVNELK